MKLETAPLASVRTKMRPDHVLTISSGPPLPPGFERGEGKHPIFFKRWRFDTCLVPNQSVHMLTGVRTFDPEYLRFLSMMVDLGGEHMPVDLDEEGFVGNSHVHKNTSTFGTVSGLGQDPMGYPLMDNGPLRESLGLPNEWRRPRDKAIMVEWLHLFFSEWVDRPIKQTKKSKSGPPFMEYEIDKKIDLVEERLETNTLNKILKKTRNKKYRDLRKDHQCIPLGVVGKRGQSDAAEKVRLVATKEYAESGGRKGQRIKANKAVVIDNVQYPKLARMRMRRVIGYNHVLNTIGQIMSTGHLYSAYDRFPLVLKFAQIEEKLKELDDFIPEEPALTVFAGDVENFDECALADFRFQTIMEVGSHYWDGDMMSLQEMLHRAPICSAPLGTGEEFYWSGNPDDPKAFVGKGSLKSGHNMVTIAGIIEMVTEFLTNCDYAFGNVLGNVKQIMEGNYLLRLWDKGDDHQVWGAPLTVKRYEEIALAEDAAGQKKYAYFRVVPEAGKQMIGNIFQRLGPRKFLAVPRIHSYHDKSHCNEHGIGEFDAKGVLIPSVFRPCWPIGAFVRKMLYGQSHAIDVYNEIREKAWTDSGCRARYGSIDAIIDAAMDKQGSFFRIARSAIDVDVMVSDGAKLNYRYSEDMVSKEVAAIYQSSINQDLTSAVAHQRYGGVIR